MHKLYVLCCLYRNYMDLNEKNDMLWGSKLSVYYDSLIHVYCNIIHSYYIFHLWWYFYYFEQTNVLGLNVFHLLDLFKFIGLYYLF